MNEQYIINKTLMKFGLFARFNVWHIM